MKSRSSRAIFSLVLVLMASAILGGVFGGQVRATTKGEEDVDAAIKQFTTLLGLVEQNYASEVDSDKAVYGAIDGMLRTLDPHSKFFEPKAFTALREDQRGTHHHEEAGRCEHRSLFPITHRGSVVLEGGQAVQSNHEGPSAGTKHTKAISHHDHHGHHDECYRGREK